jgi:hypothetical protein
VDDADHYSMQDLVDVKTGVLLHFVDQILDIFDSHIRNCVLCVAKGFFCEICDDKSVAAADTASSNAAASASSAPTPSSGQSRTRPAVIFPFDEMVSICSDCKGVFHRQCLKEAGEDVECPRCARRRKHRELKKSASAEEEEDVAKEAVEEEEELEQQK